MEKKKPVELDEEEIKKVSGGESNWFTPKDSIKDIQRPQTENASKTQVSSGKIKK